MRASAKRLSGAGRCSHVEHGGEWTAYSESLNASIAACDGRRARPRAVRSTCSGAERDELDRPGGHASTRRPPARRAARRLISSESDGTGTSGIAGNVALADQTVNVSGNVWQAAVADVQPASLDFGIVHVGDSVNGAERRGRQRRQRRAGRCHPGRLRRVDGPFSGSGDLGAGVAAGGTDNTSLNVSLDTAAAGIFGGSASLDLLSHNPDLVDLDIAVDAVGLTAQVNNYANPVFDFVTGDGSFSGGGETYLLDFGTIDLNSTALVSASLAVGNDIPAPGDFLDGLFDLSMADVFGTTGFDNFFDLNPGDFNFGLGVSLDVASLGIGDYMGSLILNPFGHNESGFRGALPAITLALRANVTDQGVALSEPDALWLNAFGMLAMLLILRLNRSRRCKAH